MFSCLKDLVAFAGLVVNMNCLTRILIMFMITVNGEIVPQNPLEKNILKFLTNGRQGPTDVGLPISLLKSVKIPSVEYYYEGRGLKLNYSIGEMLVTGLDLFVIENITASVNTLNISLTLRFPVLTLISENYNLKGSAYYFYPLRGSGKMELVLRNSIMTAKAHFWTIKDAGTTIHDLEIIFDVKKIEAHLENSSWPINAVLNSDGVQILQSYRNTIADALKNYVTPTLNKFLAKIPPSKLFQVDT